MTNEKNETIPEEIKEIQQTEVGKPMYTIGINMVVVETTKDFANPISNDKNMMELFLKNNRETMESYFNEENNYAISFYACGYNGTAQDEFIQGWLDNGVRVF